MKKPDKDEVLFAFMVATWLAGFVYAMLTIGALR